MALTLIKVGDQRLGATKRSRTPEGHNVVYASHGRTLVDTVYDWARFDSLPRAYDWIRSDLRAGRVSAEKLVRLTCRYGYQGTKRRIGALLEQTFPRA